VRTVLAAAVLLQLLRRRRLLKALLGRNAWSQLGRSVCCSSVQGLWLLYSW
jgi:hypothetical protein